MKLILSGLPGTGKTYIGEWLAKHHGFSHIDLESNLQQGLTSTLQSRGVEAFIAELEEETTPHVITIGYPPEMYTVIARLKEAGYVPWWFDAPLLFSRENWRPNIGQDPKTYLVQIQKIAHFHKELLGVYGDNRILVSDERGVNFRDPQIICSDILRADLS